MGVASSNCIRGGDVNKPVNGVDDAELVAEIRPTAAAAAPSDEEAAWTTKMESVAGVGGVVPSTAASVGDEPGKRRHSTPNCETSHLSRLGADTLGDDGVSAARCRRSGSAAPRRANRPTNDDVVRRAALPPWAEAVRSSSSSRRRSSAGLPAPELGSNDTATATNDAVADTAASAVRRREVLQTNYSSDGRLDRVESSGSGGAHASAIRFESQMSGVARMSPPRDLNPSLQPSTGSQTRPLQERRSSLAILPLSGGSSASSCQFSPRPVLPPPPTSTSTMDRINLGFGNASDFVASLISSRSPGPTANATEDHFWVPPTIWKKKRAQSLVPPKLSIDTKAVSGRSSHLLLSTFCLKRTAESTIIVRWLGIRTFPLDKFPRAARRFLSVIYHAAQIDYLLTFSVSVAPDSSQT